MSENNVPFCHKTIQNQINLFENSVLLFAEPFSNWLEEKVDLPIFENIHIEPSRGFHQQPRLKTEELKAISPVVHYENVPQPQNTSNNVQVIQSGGPTNILPAAAAQDTNLLLQEFEHVFDHVEMTHGQLTPPQSPPLQQHHHHLQQQPEQVLTPLTPIQASTFHLLQNSAAALYFQQPPQAIGVIELPPGTPQPDVAHELAVVEELVRSRAENMVDSWNNSPTSSSKSLSVIQSPSSPSSSSSSGFSEYSSDPEWIPEPVHSTESDQLVERPARGRKRAGKPYSRIGPEDKKSRKKEQNKNAATRYRLKKKAEIEEILSEEKGLIDSKTDLQAKVSDLQREIKCLKGLMRDLFKAKGLIQ